MKFHGAVLTDGSETYHFASLNGDRYYEVNHDVRTVDSAKKAAKVIRDLLDDARGPKPLAATRSFLRRGGFTFYATDI